MSTLWPDSDDEFFLRVSERLAKAEEEIKRDGRQSESQSRVHPRESEEKTLGRDTPFGHSSGLQGIEELFVPARAP